MDDKKITALLFSDDPKGLEALIRKYGKLVFTVANNILNNKEDAEECANDTYFAVKNQIPPKKPDALCPFVCRIARNVSLSARRKKNAQKRSAAVLPFSELEGVLCGEKLEKTVEAKTLGKLLDLFLDTVDEESAAVFVRRYWFSASVEEIANDFKMSEAAVYKRLSRTREKLKVYLFERGVLDE